MMMNKAAAIAILIPFSVLTGYAIVDVGYWGIFEWLIANSAGWQVFMDLAIALLLVFAWIIPDAKKHGRNPWPWLVMTLFLGSFGPLLYLVTQPSEKRIPQQA